MAFDAAKGPPDDFVPGEAPKPEPPAEGARGSTNVEDVIQRQNFAMFFGCKPADGVLAETKMV